jgi:hypothetical protein
MRRCEVRYTAVRMSLVCLVTAFIAASVDQARERAGTS